MIRPEHRLKEPEEHYVGATILSGCNNFKRLYIPGRLKTGTGTLCKAGFPEKYLLVFMALTYFFIEFLMEHQQGIHGIDQRRFS